MATQWVSMLGGSILPDSSGNVYLQPFDNVATNKQWKNLVWTFDDTSTKIGFYGTFQVPNNYIGTLEIVPVWSASVTSGNVVWQIDYRCVGGDDTTSLDQSGTQETPNYTDAAPGAAWRRLLASPAIQPTSANFAATNTMEFYFNRRGDSGSDTMAGAAYLWDLMFKYSDV